ncbi:MAG: hypothetical protein ACRD4B_00640, partial [Acidobacteriota bacterium]
MTKTFKNTFASDFDDEESRVSGIIAALQCSALHYDDLPPVPIRPTIKPETPPPRTSVFEFAGKASRGLTRNVTESDIRNTPSMS